MPINRNESLDLSATPSSCVFDRRVFLQGMAAAAGAVLVGGCTDENAPGTVENLVKAQAIENQFKVPGAGKLQAGQALAFVFPDDSPGLAFVTKDGAPRALSAKCTHSGCTVAWKNNSEIDCPCHGSRFDLDGRVLKGPAKTPLPSYKARKEGDDFWIEAAK